MSKYSKKLSGYTLIELLVGIIIISILFGVGFAGFRDFSRRQSLESLSRKIKGDLSLAREKSVSGEKPYNSGGTAHHAYCLSPNTLSGYNFRVTTSNNYVLEAVCSGGTVEVKSVDIPEGMSISIPLVNPLFFKVLSKGTNLSTDLEITITQVPTGKTSLIYVTKVGEIK